MQVVQHLTDVFARNGFPGVLVLDNGSQFTSKRFKDFCERLAIKKIESAPYCPQSNGVVERLHGTLTPMIQKCIEEKRYWAEVVPLVLFFIRMTPVQTSGFSPFMIKHGWEPVTPLQLLYKGWVQKEFEDIDITDWVILNMERVQSVRDRASANYRESTQKRKIMLDKKAKERILEVGTKVLYRTPGRDTKL